MKAKDLRGKNIGEEPLNDAEEEGETSPQEDAVTAAYENISKKLESIRNGKKPDEEESRKNAEEEQETAPEPELEEWKGRRPPERKLEASDEHELRKVKLGNLEDMDKETDKPEEQEDLEEKVGGEGLEDDETEEGLDMGDKMEKKKWEPKADDPLDEEDELEEFEKEDEEAEESDQKTENDFMREESLSDPVEDRKITRDDMDPVHSDITAGSSEESDEPQKSGPDTLDDLAEESPFGQRQAHGHEEKDQEPIRKNTIEDELPLEEYSIPNLKGSRQEGGSMGYNARPEREGVGQSYSPRGNMDGNDPNNFFSQHQPQPAKRANKFHLLILVIIGIAVIGFTVYVLKGGFGDIQLGSAPSPSPSPTVTPVATPTPTPEPEVDRGSFTVKVLNGTTTSGLAGKVRDKMKELGYKTATPGNNSDTDVSQTEIRVKEGTQSAALLQVLIKDLAPDYSAKEGDKLDSKTSYDAEVIIGAK